MGDSRGNCTLLVLLASGLRLTSNFTVHLHHVKYTPSLIQDGVPHLEAWLPHMFSGFSSFF